MRLRLSLFAAAAVAALAFAGSASAHHNVGPCGNATVAGEPGHSEFAQHHVAPQAREGMLGAGGHKPGMHRGFSACNPSENRP